MRPNRLFIPQDALNAWLDEGRANIDGEVMTVPEQNDARYQLTTALRFVSEVAGGGDEHGLVGKVKDISQLEELGGEHCADSVVLGDNAYEVIEGFLGEPTSGGSGEMAALGAAFLGS